jgi:TonB-linked SusC/RagA family outer membrane protein
VLKDASATAIYGSRGANGVVIITTKRGAAGRTSVNFDSYYGVQQATRMVKMLDATQFAELHNEILGNGDLDLNPAFSDPAALGRGTDWLGELFRTAPIRNYNLSVAGGSEKTQFAVSGGYFKQDGIIIGTDFDRYSLRFNLDTQVSDRLRFGSSIGLSRTTQQIVTTDEDTQSGLVYLAMAQQPTLPVYENGTFAGPLGPVAFVGDKSNPIGIANTVDNSIHKNRLLGSVYGEYEIIPGLKYRLNLGLDALFRKGSYWSPDYTWGGIVHPLSELSQTSTNELIWLAENTLTYSKNFGKHALTALAGTTAQASYKEFMTGATKDFASNATRVLGAGNPKNAFVNGGAEEWSLLSYIGRVNYGFADKYLFTGTVRVDGSSRFGRGNKFGVFPSGSVAWRLSEEGFFQPLTRTINDLKVRASYGITGNQEIGLYPFAALLDLNQRYTLGSPNSYYTGVGPSNLPNPNVRWEQVAQADLGVDVALLQNRIQLTADYYVKNTSGMLLALPIPATTGYAGPPTVNVGKVRNQGIELGINSQNLTGALKWNTSLNFASNRNTVVSLGDSLPINGGGISFQQTLTRTQVGHPIGSFFGYVTDGIFQTQEEVNNHAEQNPGDNPATSTAPGDIRFRDLNSDGKIDDKDRTFIGNPMPKFIFGLTNNFSFKGFDLSVFVQGIVGNKVYNVNRTYNEQMSGAFNQTAETLNRWRSATQPGNGSVPRAVWNDPNYNARPSDRFVEDGSYVRIKNLTLGYALPGSLLSALKIAQIRLYATAQNLYTFTKFKGFDPETGSYQQSSLYTGVNNGTYPVARTLIMGLNVGF